ncbi:MAG: NYN domain-containing protein [Patescibacteria group bacterium]|nr:NYN domain-containing protein [Patescibacteria group bacterium]
MPNHYTEKLKIALKKRVFIYIDAANLERSVQDMWVSPKDVPDDLKKFTADQLRYRIDYQKFKEYFKSLADVREVKFYSADFCNEQHGKFLWFLKKVLNFKLETKPLKEYLDHTPEAPHRKANFDVELSVDATYKLNEYDTLILFSGDCDFEYLIKFLKGHGKVVIVFSRVGHVAKELPPASSYYFDLIDFRNELLKIEEKKQKIPL